MKCEGPIRAFIAVELSEEVRKNLVSVQEDLHSANAQVGWVRPEGMHLTVFFLGNIMGESVEVVSGMLDKCALSVSPSVCEAAGVGYFGNPRSPRVIWVGVTGGTQVLSDIHAYLAVELKSTGLACDEREYAPHLTIGRVRSRRNAEELLKKLSKYEKQRFGSFNVDKLLLVRSELQSDGPVYTVLHSAHFK
jgi:2'-5' RNA ligase